MLIGINAFAKVVKAAAFSADCPRCLSVTVIAVARRSLIKAEVPGNDHRKGVMET